jgi:hypothetical protein
VERVFLRVLQALQTQRNKNKKNKKPEKLSKSKKLNKRKLKKVKNHQAQKFVFLNKNHQFLYLLNSKMKNKTVNHQEKSLLLKNHLLQN